LKIFYLLKSAAGPAIWRRIFCLGQGQRRRG